MRQISFVTLGYKNKIEIEILILKPDQVKMVKSSFYINIFQ